MNKLNWVKCDSRGDMESRLSSMNDNVFDELTAEYSNTWGFFVSEKKDICIPLGFCDVGLAPQIFIQNMIIFIGVNELVAGYDLKTGELTFKYKMPTVFHEFVSLGENGIIVQDETGFVGLSNDGTEKWIKLFSDVISNYLVVDNIISGETEDGEKFKFSMNQSGSDKH